MAQGVRVASLSWGGKSTSYSKHARMALAYPLLLIHSGMTMVASSLVATRRRMSESGSCTGGMRNPLGWSDESESSRIAVDCSALSDTYVYGP